MKVVEVEAAPSVRREHRTLVLQVRPGVDVAARREVLSGWYRDILKAAVPPLIARLGAAARRLPSKAFTSSR